MRPRHHHTDAQANLSSDLSGFSAPLSSDVGDDLTRSRLFCLKAGQQITAIVEASRDTHPTNTTPAQGRDPIWLCERLGIIQREAKRARARAIYRSAQDVLSLIQRCNVHMPINWTRVDGRLFVLNKLLNQYEEGLQELERESPPELLIRPDLTLADPSTITFDPVHEIAKETLASLLPHAREQERNALERLIQIDPTPEVEPETLIDPVAEVKSQDASPKAPDRIEWMMPGLVQDLLEVGRDYGKLFSVSHSLDDVLIKTGTSEIVRERMFDRLSDIVRSDLPLQGVGRLDISATESGLTVSGSGFEPVMMALDERVAPSLEAIAEEIEKPASDPTRRPVPRITDNVEADLRAQLSALITGHTVEDA
ncbi:MAG: hypothetical protein AAFP97_04235 [Pseudomonadota bacterium]